MPNKSLGQHWLKDRGILGRIADDAQLTADDTVLEIGPGLGTLTSELLRRAGRVVAVEYDAALAAKLPAQFPGKNLQVITGDFLEYDLSQLPEEYVVVANVPYYITTKIVQRLIRAENRPRTIVLLVQQEVAEKLAADPGELTPLTVEAQLEYDIQISTPVPKMYFTPPPKVDSQVVVLRKHRASQLSDEDKKSLLRVIYAGFSSPRKKLRSSLAGALAIDKGAVDAMLAKAAIDPNCRAQDLSVEEWKKLL